MDLKEIEALKKENITADESLHDVGWNGAINEVLKTLKVGQHETIVNCKYPRRTQDDFVFIYRNDDGDCRVFGISDANYYHKNLLENGYKHTSTLSASIWIERLIESSHYDRGDMIDNIDS